MNARILRLTATLAGILLLPASSFAVDSTACVDGSCFCEPADATNGIYWARVDGGNQATVVQIVEPNPTGSDPDTIVVPGLSEPSGTMILYTDNGFLVERDGGVVCAGRSSGAITRSAAEALVRSNDCWTDVPRYVPNACEATALACSATPMHAAWAPGALALGALIVRRRRAAR